MSRAQKWRNCLMGSPSTIFFKREYSIKMEYLSKYDNEIQNDLKRTFPTSSFFTDHIVVLSDILNTYAYVNDGMGYAQGMAFIVFTLFKVYYEDDPIFATEDTFYSFHKVVQVIRPVYPLNAKDEKVLVFHQNLVPNVTLLLSKYNPTLAKRVNEIGIMDLLLYQNIPSLFCNKFEITDCCLLWDFILRKKHYDMFHRVLCVLAGMIISLEPVIMDFNIDSIMSIMQDQHTYNVRRVILHAHKVL